MVLTASKISHPQFPATQAVAVVVRATVAVPVPAQEVVVAAIHPTWVGDISPAHSQEEVRKSQYP